ncbi:unnamed protein product [Phaeothamnion confervicola]
MASAWRDKGVRIIGLGWTGFILENLILSENRTELINSFGDVAYHNVYNSLSVAACSTIAYGYLRHGRRKGAQLWVSGGPPRRVTAFLLQACGLIGFSQLLPRIQLPFVAVGDAAPPPPQQEPSSGSRQTLQRSSPGAAAAMAAATTATALSSDSTAQKTAYRARCPMDFRPPDVPHDGVYGLSRVTRHPALYSMAFIGLGSAVATPLAAEAVFFVMPAVFAVVGSAHIDSRHRRGIGGRLTPETEAVTSNLPFAALLSGEQSWEKLWGELKRSNAAFAVAAAAGFALRRRRLGRW